MSPTDAPQSRPIPPHHLVILGAVSLLVVGTVMVASRLNDAPDDPWALVEEVQGPLHIALGVPRDELGPARLVLPADDDRRPAILRAYKPVQLAAPALDFGPVEEGAHLSLGKLRPCLGGTAVIAILELPLAHSSREAASAYPFQSWNGRGSALAADDGLCIVVAFRQVEAP